MGVMLNITGATSAGTVFGQGTGHIALSNVGCIGIEERLADCSSVTSFSCTHSQDSGVRCQLRQGRKVKQ